MFSNRAPESEQLPNFIYIELTNPERNSLGLSRGDFEGDTFHKVVQWIQDFCNKNSVKIDGMMGYNDLYINGKEINLGRYNPSLRDMLGYIGVELEQVLNPAVALPHP